MTPEQRRVQESVLKECGQVKEVVDSSPFIIDAVVDVASPTGVFVDSGCLSYCVVNASFARKRSLKRFSVPPRQLQLAAGEAPKPTIREVVEFDLDIDGWTKRTVGYVIPDLMFPVILGKPWLEMNDVVYYAKDRKLEVGVTGQVIRERGWTKAEEFAPFCARPAGLRVMTAAFKAAKGALYAEMEAIMRLAKKEREQAVLKGPQSLRRAAIFTTSMAEINQALKPKLPITRADIEAALPLPLRHHWWTFFPKDGSELPPHRPHLDHAIELQKDESGNEVAAP